MPWNDLMAMAGLGDGALVASGHPDLRLENYHVVDHPPFLGLTRSDDGGRSWEVVDLLGDADLHALALVGDQIFGAETTGRIWRLDADGTWNSLARSRPATWPFDPIADQATLVIPDLLGFGRSPEESQERFAPDDHLDALDEMLDAWTSPIDLSV